MSRNSLVVAAFAFAGALAGCARVAPPTLGAAASAVPMQASHGDGPFRVEWSVERPGRISGRIYNDYQDGASTLASHYRVTVHSYQIQEHP